MGLQIRRKTSRKLQIISTLIAVFALVAQPMYGVMANRVANAASETLINEDFSVCASSDSQPTPAISGWTWSNTSCYDNNGASNSAALKFGENNSSATVNLPHAGGAGAAATLTFWLDGLGLQAGGSSKFAIIQLRSDNTTSDQTTYSQADGTLTNTSGTKTITLDPSTTSIEFLYGKDAGNLALDDVKATASSPTNTAPVITSNGGGTTATVDVPENTTAVTTVTATDTDGDTPTYSIVSGADANLFKINSATGVLAFKSAPDFENPIDSDGDNTYEVIVQASDGNGGTANQTITVTIKNVNETPATPPTVIVKQGELHGWTKYAYSTNGSSDFASDSSAPLGSGALKLSTPTGGDIVQYYRDATVATPVKDINISYSTKRLAGSTTAAPSYVLGIDTNGDSSDDFYAWYEPVYNDTTSTNYNQWNTWQLNQTAKFWSKDPDAPGSGSWRQFTLADVVAMYPSAKVIDYTINQGSGNDGFVTLVDDVVTPEAVYDFENTPTDSTGPTITIDSGSPANGDYLSGVRWTRQGQSDQQRNRFIFNITDPSGVWKGYMNLHNMATGQKYHYKLTQHVAPHQEQWYADVDTTKLPDGVYQVEVRAVDNAGNPRYFNNRLESYSVTVDNTAPVIRINNQTPESTYKLSDSINVHIVEAHRDHTDVDRTDTQAPTNDQHWSYAGEWFGLSWLKDGQYKLTAYDKAGNQAVVSFTTDRTKPHVDTNSTGANDPDYNPTNFTVHATDDIKSGWFNTGIAKVTGNIYKYDAVQNKYTLLHGNSSTTNPFTVDLSSLSDGTYYVRYNAQDGAGNISNTEQYYFVVDTTKPTISNIKAVVNPGTSHERTVSLVGKNTSLLVKSGDKVTVTIKVDGTGSDVDWAKVRAYEQNVAAGNWHTYLFQDQSMTDNGNGTYSYTFTVPSEYMPVPDDTDHTINEGQYKNAIDFNVRDKASNTRGAELYFTIDNTKPASPSIKPVDNSTIKGTQKFTVTSNEPITSVVSSQGTLIDSHDGTWSLDTTQMMKGASVTITATATDAAGNTSTASTTYTVDNSALAPVVTIDEPTMNKKDGTYTISGTTTSSQPVFVSWNSTMAPVEIAPTSGVWSIGGVEFNGGRFYQIVATTTDQFGYMTTEEFDYRTPAVDTSDHAARPASLTRQFTPIITRSIVTPHVGDHSDQAVLGAQNDKSNSGVLGDTAALAPSAQGWKLFGVAWYWWLLLVAVIAALWAWLAAARRRHADEA